MTKDEFDALPDDTVLQVTVKDLRAALSYRAYEQGHASGEDEIALIYDDLVYDVTKDMKVVKP